ncbi:hypothetical protein NDA16_003883 [Ustilago loliicola]|nr:hypothetical protein NDA16_003883 [Ustilago loliicola]
MTDPTLPRQPSDDGSQPRSASTPASTAALNFAYPPQAVTSGSLLPSASSPSSPDHGAVNMDDDNASQRLSIRDNDSSSALHFESGQRSTNSPPPSQVDDDPASSINNDDIEELIDLCGDGLRLETIIDFSNEPEYAEGESATPSSTSAPAASATAAPIDPLKTPPPPSAPTLSSPPSGEFTFHAHLPPNVKAPDWSNKSRIRFNAIKPFRRGCDQILVNTFGIQGVSHMFRISVIVLEHSALRRRLPGKAAGNRSRGFVPDKRVKPKFRVKDVNYKFIGPLTRGHQAAANVAAWSVDPKLDPTYPPNLRAWILEQDRIDKTAPDVVDSARAQGITKGLERGQEIGLKKGAIAKRDDAVEHVKDLKPLIWAAGGAAFAALALGAATIEISPVCGTMAVAASAIGIAFNGLVICKDKRKREAWEKETAEDTEALKTKPAAKKSKKDEKWGEQMIEFRDSLMTSYVFTNAAPQIGDNFNNTIYACFEALTLGLMDRRAFRGHVYCYTLALFAPIDGIRYGRNGVPYGETAESWARKKSDQKDRRKGVFIGMIPSGKGNVAVPTAFARIIVGCGFQLDESRKVETTRLIEYGTDTSEEFASDVIYDSRRELRQFDDINEISTVDVFLIPHAAYSAPVRLDEFRTSLEHIEELSGREFCDEFRDRPTLRPYIIDTPFYSTQGTRAQKVEEQDNE